jgi:hypothetical protein
MLQKDDPEQASVIRFSREDAETLWVALSLMLDDWEDEYSGEGPRGSMAWHVVNASKILTRLVDYLGG